GQLGNPDATKQLTPMQIVVPGVQRWSWVAAGNYATYAIDETGDLYSWGDNEFKQLGRKDENDGGIDHTIPGKVDHPEVGVKWRSIHMLPGTDHVLAIDVNGRLWGWGDNYHGQIGNGLHGDGQKVWEPFQIILSEAPNATWLSASTAFGVFNPASGGISMAIIDEDGMEGSLNGSLWAWGDNSQGGLGLGYASGIVPRPLRVEAPR
ncbi:MAG: hypothetical protein FWD94_06480, partial [Treponema sp.]|nr:hypothetical protein [Treponema sp.]